MDSKKKKKVITIIVSIALVAVIALSATLYFVLSPKKNKEDQDNATNVSDTIPVSSYEYITNSYNESILEKVLSTTNYSGRYKLATIQSVEFNLFSKDNVNGLTEENILSLYQNCGVKDSNGFNKYLLERRLSKGDQIRINSKITSNGDSAEYGIFVTSSSTDAYSACVGNLYGDENLAVVLFEDKDNFDDEFFIRNKVESSLFISLKYGKNIEAAIVADGTSNDSANTIYVFENVYSQNNKNLRLFTVTYAYKLIPVSSSVTGDDLHF